MLGAIIGDITGSVYEFDNIKTTDFPFFGKRSNYTDDSIISVAVAKWLLEDENHTTEHLEKCMVEIANKYPCPMGGYGGGFSLWLFHPEQLYDYQSKERNASHRHPYNSFGNGSAMRVSAVGWMFDTLEETERVAKISAGITHNHPEGIKGAQSTAAAIFMARNGSTKEEIKKYIEEKYGYDLHRTCDEIRPSYHFEASCQKTVPEAMIAFLDSTDFENAIRLAVSLGGDSDTLACITGGIAEAFYKEIPIEIEQEAMALLPEDFKEVVNRIHKTPYRSNSMSQHESKRYTPQRISSLAENEIFVFGSNLRGMHAGGAARTAVLKFGAIWGQGVGLQGQSYAIPTMQGGVETIKPYVDEFIEFARQHTEYKFYVTRIGCGIAGFTDEDIAPLFAQAVNLQNVYLPREFVSVLTK